MSGRALAKLTRLLCQCKMASYQGLWYANGLLLWAHNWCSNELSLHTISTLNKHVTRIKYNWGYIRLLVLVSLVILLYMPNLLASMAKLTIALHKANFGSDKDRLAFLRGIA